MTAALEGGERSAARPGRTLPPGKDRVPILQGAGWAPGPVWMGGKSRPHRDSIPDLPARSSVAIPTKLPGPQFINKRLQFCWWCSDYGMRYRGVQLIIL